jgi:hypothetical protein
LQLTDGQRLQEGRVPAAGEYVKNPGTLAFGNKAFADVKAVWLVIADGFAQVNSGTALLILITAY